MNNPSRLLDTHGHEIWIPLQTLVSLVLFLTGHCEPPQYSTLLQTYLHSIAKLRGEQMPLRDLMPLLNSRVSLSGSFYKQVMQEFLRYLRPMRQCLVGNQVQLAQLIRGIREQRLPLVLLANYALAQSDQ